MCYHVASYSKIQRLRERFRANAYEELEIRSYYHIRAQALPKLPVLCADHPHDIQLATWGYLPTWANHKPEEEQLEARRMCLNAISEEVFTKRSYSHEVAHQRGMVLVDGFFEFRHEGTRKIPYFICMKDRQPFGMGMVYSDAGATRSFSILTTAANPLMAHIHNSKQRMPFIIPPEAEETWLKTDLPPESIQSLMHPLDEHEMTAWPVRPDLLRTGFDSNQPEILLPVAEQGGLF